MSENKVFVFESESKSIEFMEAIVDITGLFLEEEGGISTVEYSIDLTQSRSVELMSLTSIITVEDSAKMILAFSYEKGLIQEVFKKYSAGIEIPEDEVQMYIEETAGDMVNIVVGNLLTKFQQPGIAFTISTPVIINEAKSISRYKNTKFYSAVIKTKVGQMSIYCISPGELYRKHFKQEGVEQGEKVKHYDC